MSSAVKVQKQCSKPSNESFSSPPLSSRLCQNQQNVYLSAKDPFPLMGFSIENS